MQVVAAMEKNTKAEEGVIVLRRRILPLLVVVVRLMVPSWSAVWDADNTGMEESFIRMVLTF